MGLFDDDDDFQNWTLTEKAVNSKPLFNEIHDFIAEGLNDMGVVWNSDSHRDSFISIVEDWLEEKWQEGKIEQFKVICDFRNNKIADMESGKYIIDVYYKQRNCLNTTQLHYEVQEEEELTIDFLLE